MQQTDLTWILEESGLGEEIIREINADTNSNIVVDIYDIEEFLRRSAVSEQLGAIIEGYIRALSEGNLNYSITSREVASVLRSIAPDIQDQFGYSLTRENVDAIVNSLDEHIDLRELRVDNLLRTADLDITVPFLIFSVYPLIIVGILCTLVIFNIFLLHRRRVRTAFIAAGIPIMLSGLLFTSTGFLLSILPGWLGSIETQNMGTITVGIARLIMLHGSVCFAVGVVSLVAFFVLRNVGNRRARNSFGQPRVSKASKTKAWLIAGLLTNAALLSACVIVSLLFYTNIP
jgi:hypothetical protein